MAHPAIPLPDGGDPVGFKSPANDHTLPLSDLGGISGQYFPVDGTVYQKVGADAVFDDGRIDDRAHLLEHVNRREVFARSRGVTMVPKNLESVMEVVRLMIGAERAVSDFYQACSKRFPHNEDFWKELEHEETVHAEMLSLMLRRVSEKPQEFQVGNVASITGVNAFLERLQEDLQKVQSGQLDEDAAIFQAFHIESTFIDQRYTEAVTTQNEEYVSVLNQLRAETGAHKARIAKRMKRHKSYEPQS